MKPLRLKLPAGGASFHLVREWAEGETIWGRVDRVSFGERGLLRIYEPGDYDAWLRAAADTDPIDAEWVPTLNPTTRERNARIRTIERGHANIMGKLGIFVDNALVGELGWTLGHPRGVKVEYWLRRVAREKGTTRLALGAFIKAVRESGLDPDCWIASIRAENKRSEKLVTSLGFEPLPASAPNLPREWYLRETGRSTAL